MGYTMSFDASLKLKAGDVKGYLMHFDRDDGLQQVQHSNPNINPENAIYNQTLYYNRDSGNFDICTDRQQLVDALQARLSCVKKTLRKDATVARPLILQLDPAWYKDNQVGLDDERSEKAAEDMLTWAVSRFNAENIIGVSVHNDEASPHMHILFAPVTDDSRLSQKDWFKNPATLRELHQDLRQHMTDCGYDIDMQNRKPGKHAKRMPEDEYRDFKRLQEQAAQLDAREDALKAREAILEQQARQQAIKQLELESKAEELRQKESIINVRSELSKKRLDEILGLLQDCEATVKQPLQQRYNAAVGAADGLHQQSSARREIPDYTA